MDLGEVDAEWIVPLSEASNFSLSFVTTTHGAAVFTFAWDLAL